MGSTGYEFTDKAECEATTLLKILTNRGIVVSDVARERIGSCRDSEQLDQWLKQIFAVETVEELFA